MTPSYWAFTSSSLWGKLQARGRAESSSPLNFKILGSTASSWTLFTPTIAAKHGFSPSFPLMSIHCNLYLKGDKLKSFPALLTLNLVEFPSITNFLRQEDSSLSSICSLSDESDVCCDSFSSSSQSGSSDFFRFLGSSFMTLAELFLFFAVIGFHIVSWAQNFFCNSKTSGSFSSANNCSALGPGGGLFILVELGRHNLPPSAAEANMCFRRPERPG